MTRVLVVSGTGTGVGKTVVPVAIAVLAIARGDRDAPVAVVAAAGPRHAQSHRAHPRGAGRAKDRARGHSDWPLAGPGRPGIAERASLTDLQTIAGGPLAGILPDGTGGLDRAGFLAAATAGLAGCLGGAGQLIEQVLISDYCRSHGANHCVIRYKGAT